ncbi:unnamed protein product [Wickerhamomyces anomalus]
MSAVENFVEVLDGLKSMKTGISGTRIRKLTQLAVDNVSVKSQFVEKAEKYLKEAGENHKLGALYVIDSIARAYKEKANKLGETVNASAKDGTYADALYKLNTFIPEALTIVLDTVTSEQKEKVGKLLDIWKKSATFEAQQLQPIKNKYFVSNSGSNAASASGTPQTAPAPAPQPTDPNEILKNLAALAGNNQPAPAPVPAPVQAQAPVPAPGQLPNLAALSSSDPNAQQAALFQMLQTLQATGQMPPLPTTATTATNATTRTSTCSRYSRRGGRERSRSPRSDGRNAPPPGHVIGERNIPGTPHYREKFVSSDPNVPDGSIKVLSRTLFIGGVPNYMDDQELASVLRPYAEVQSVILNNERKHAFVKVYSRAEAESVISSFNKNGALSLRTRWGVGFGPRDCCDYQHGTSLIPIERLTDADRRWVNAAEWGGIGLERPLTSGLVMEEPDIEIGEGVSSKAISKKMPTDGSRNGPRSTKPGEPDDIYTDPLNNSNIPSFMQGGNKANPLANLFNQTQSAAPAPAPAPPAAGGEANAQLSNLMAFLQQQQQK